MSVLSLFFPFIFHSKISVECFASTKIIFSDCYCVFFYDRGWWRQILSTTVRSLWQEPLILLEAQCVPFNDHAILLCFDTFGGSPTWTQALGLPGTVTATIARMQLEVSKRCWIIVHWEPVGSFFDWATFKHETTHFEKLISIFF